MPQTSEEVSQSGLLRSFSDKRWSTETFVELFTEKGGHLTGEIDTSDDGEEGTDGVDHVLVGGVESHNPGENDFRGSLDRNNHLLFLTGEGERRK